MSDRKAARAEPWILAASILGSSMAFIDGTVVNVALPVLQQDLAATATEVQWVVEGYLLTLSALLLLGGALADRLGRRRVFISGVTLFTAASVSCGLAPEINWLIGSRVVQGVGGALLIPLALLGAGFPPERRGLAIGKWSAFTAAAAGVGPVLGGWLVQVGSWRWVFWLNLPLAAATLAIMLTRVPESRAPGKTPLDLLGATLATLGLGALVFRLLEAPRLGFDDSLIVAALTGGVLTLGAVVWVETHSASPMLAMEVFRSQTFSGANLVSLFLYAALGGVVFFHALQPDPSSRVYSGTIGSVTPTTHRLIVSPLQLERPTCRSDRLQATTGLRASHCGSGATRGSPCPGPEEPTGPPSLLQLRSWA